MDDLVEKYNNPLIRALIQLIPFGIGSAIDVSLIEIINQHRHKRLRAFFDELGNGVVQLDEDLISNDDFLYCYFNTIKAVINTNRQEKIVYIAHLFQRAVSKRDFKDSDEYEYYLSVLDELSFTEIEILLMLFSFENDFPSREGTYFRLSENKKFWRDFLTTASNKFDVPIDIIEGILIRIERSGCIHYGRHRVNDLSSTVGCTTSVFKKLVGLIVE